jgi:DNA-directed RNA polymerase specialized sigma24 family protein
VALPLDSGPPYDDARQAGTLLRGTFQLGEIDSVELFCRQVLDDRLRQWGAWLNRTEYDDALSYLIAETWQLWKRFDPARGTRFSTYAYRILSRRVTSWYRQRFGDGRYRHPPTWVSLDEELDTLAVDGTPADTDPPSRINERTLTPEARQVLEKIARPMAETGLNQGEIAERLGHPRCWVVRGLARLREELEPMLLDDERSAWSTGAADGRP